MMAASLLLLVIWFLHFAHGLEYVVYPADKKNAPACAQINGALVKLLGDSRVKIYSSRIRQTTEFWLVRAGVSQKESLLEIPGVRIRARVQDGPL